MPDSQPSPIPHPKTGRNAGFKLALIVIAGALAVAAGYLAGRSPAKPVAEPAGVTVLDDPRPIPPFSLTGAGGPFTNAQLAGQWTYIFFGYTHCPDVCPTALSLMREIKAQLKAASGPMPQVVFVSIDPKRDTPGLLGQYVPAFDPAFIGVTGSDEALAPLIKHFGIYFKRHEEDSALNYTVDHSAGIYLVDPRGHLKALYMPPQDAQTMARNLLALSESRR